MIPSNRCAPLAALLTLSCLPVAVHAWDLKSISLQHELTDYSGQRGDRSVSQAKLDWETGRHTVILDLAHGRRDYGGDVHHGERAAVIAHHVWSRRWSSRSLLASGSDDAVFANRQVGQRVNYKVGRSLVLHGGATWSSYHGHAHALAWQGAASFYRGSWVASARYTYYDVSNRDDGHGYLVSLRRRDAAGVGSTQLWLGRGTSAFEYVAGAELRDQHSKAISLRRVQPLSGELRLHLSVGRAWNESSGQHYHGTTGSVGLSHHW
jgi:YaiO family outer membrane protein